MKNKKNFYLNLLTFIGSPVFIVAGILMIVLCDNSRLKALGGVAICLAAVALFIGFIRVLFAPKDKENTRDFFTVNKERENAFNDALKAFQSKTDYPEVNTVKLVGSGLEFFAEGRYVCVKNFKNINGYHFAFEINSTKLKLMPEGYDDVCDLESNGVIVMAGYHDGIALEKYATDHGIILQDTVENSIGKTIILKQHRGYKFCVSTAEDGEANLGFVKILKCENDVLTVYFSISVPFGLNDTVEGTVELKKEADGQACDINSLIHIIKVRRYNLIGISSEEVQAIKQANPFLPESYITFLREVGFADLKWIDIGRNIKTPTNLYDTEITYMNEILADYKDYNLDDYYFIGADSDASYYALSRKADDKKVYIFSNDATGIATYESFEKFLNEILNV